MAEIAKYISPVCRKMFNVLRQSGRSTDAVCFVRISNIRPPLPKSLIGHLQCNEVKDA
jgi:hypothetical protein